MSELICNTFTKHEGFAAVQMTGNAASIHEVSWDRNQGCVQRPWGAAPCCYLAGRVEGLSARGLPNPGQNRLALSAASLPH